MGLGPRGLTLGRYAGILLYLAHRRNSNWPFDPTNRFMIHNSNGLFIVGTDTGVGKTRAACLIAKSLVSAGHRVGVYKPVASGVQPADDGRRTDDAAALWEAAGRPLDVAAVCPQVFSAPLAPPLAAKAERQVVQEKRLVTGIRPWLSYEYVIIEGAGGLLSPISERWLVADLAKQFGVPCLIVAANRLGVLNSVLLTLESCASRGLKVAGIVLNEVNVDPSDASRSLNRAELSRWTQVPVVGYLAFDSKEFHEDPKWTAFFEPLSLSLAP